MTNIRIQSLVPVYGAAEIDERITLLAAKINADYAGKDDVVALCVLKGACLFFADLVRRLDFGPQIDFLRLSSYGSGDVSSGTVAIEFSGAGNLQGKHVLVVEDIVDSGRSMAFLKDYLQGQGVKTLRIVSLIDKSERREVDIAVDYVGFSVPAGFLVGYGLDYAERFRELPALYTLELED